MTGKLTQTDEVTEHSIFERIFEVSGVNHYDDAIGQFLKEMIKELYYSHKHLIFKLRLSHIDRAIFKYRQAKEKIRIRNTKQYFKACLVSAIFEAELDELEPLELEQVE